MLQQIHGSDIPSACHLVRIAQNLGEQVTLKTRPKVGLGDKMQTFSSFISVD